MATIIERIAEFRATVSADLYAPSDIVDIRSALASVSEFSPEADVLRQIGQQGINASTLSDALLQYPRLYSILCAIFSISSSISLEDGRALTGPLAPPRTHEAAVAAASIFLELGLLQVVQGNIDVRQLLLILQIASDAAKRRFRVDAKLNSRIAAAVDAAVSASNLRSPWEIALGANSQVPAVARRFADFLVTVEGKPRVVIATTFQTASGGRQNRELSTVYPSVNESLAATGMDLVLIADGQALGAMPDRVLRELFARVPHTFNLKQLERGQLADLFDRLAVPIAPPQIDRTGLRRLIESLILEKAAVEAASLPVEDNEARLALAQFVEAHGALSLELLNDGRTMRWTRSTVVESLIVLRGSFDPVGAIDAVAMLMGASTDGASQDADFPYATLQLANEIVLSAPVMVTALEEPPSADTLRDLAKQALRISPDSKLALVVTRTALSPDQVRTLRAAQPTLPVTVIVLGLDRCLDIARANATPRDSLRSVILEQTDLQRLSPFVTRGAAPSRVFFGREEEEAALISTLPTNSVALLGGRRIGKTSLLLHSSGRLAAADLRPFFGDCQVVKTWADFGSMAKRNWQVELPSDFRPQHLFELVDKLDDSSGRSIVFLLDEIDQLLQWDAKRTDDEVPEAFFRACRSISQQGLAQFVFSGERTIAGRLWDATSPHWNFCRPLMIQQLTRRAADSLIAEPLTALGLEINSASEFLDACWAVSDGHPELLQYLGNRIVESINKDGNIRTSIYPSDVESVVAQFDYAEQYLATYWGQATTLEKLVSLLCVKGPHSMAEFLAATREVAGNVEARSVEQALHVLELYGITQREGEGYSMRAHWFSSALEFYGGVDDVIQQQISAGVT